MIIKDGVFMHGKKCSKCGEELVLEVTLDYSEGMLVIFSDGVMDCQNCNEKFDPFETNKEEIILIKRTALDSIIEELKSATEAITTKLNKQMGK